MIQTNCYVTLLLMHRAYMYIRIYCYSYFESVDGG